MQIGELPITRYEVRRGLKLHCCTRKIDWQAQLYAASRSTGANKENPPRCIARAFVPREIVIIGRPVNGVYVSASVGDVNTNFSCKQSDSFDEATAGESGREKCNVRPNASRKKMFNGLATGLRTQTNSEYFDNLKNYYRILKVHKRAD